MGSELTAGRRKRVIKASKGMSLGFLAAEAKARSPAGMSSSNIAMILFEESPTFTESLTDHPAFATRNSGSSNFALKLFHRSQGQDSRYSIHQNFIGFAGATAPKDPVAPEDVLPKEQS